MCSLQNSVVTVVSIGFIFMSGLVKQRASVVNDEYE